MYVSEAESILKHSLVPKHEVISDSAAEKMLKKYSVTKNQLPCIKESDPVVEAISAKKGQVLKITRSSLTAGTAVTYRIVV